MAIRESIQTRLFKSHQRTVKQIHSAYNFKGFVDIGTTVTGMLENDVYLSVNTSAGVILGITNIQPLTYLLFNGLTWVIVTTDTIAIIAQTIAILTSKTQKLNADGTINAANIVYNSSSQFQTDQDVINALNDIFIPHVNSLGNPHNVTKEQMGLENVDNTSDILKPVSYPQQTEIFLSRFENYISVQDFGASPNSPVDNSNAFQSAFSYCYEYKRKLMIPEGEYIFTRAVYIPDGLCLIGHGKYNTVLKTAFRKKAKYFKVGTEDYQKALIAESYVARDTGAVYNTATNPNSVPELDLVNGHNRFHIGDGSLGYYDDDRDTNPAHPLYYPNDGSGSWTTWKAERDNIKAKGIWVGLTGRENYAKGLLKSTQKPGLIHTLDNTSSDYVRKRAGSIMHTGLRNVELRDFTVTTNSVDRSTDSAINFRYDASLIAPSLRETYDSSVLGIKLLNLNLEEIGGTGYEVTRAVQNTLTNITAKSCAGFGFYIDGVTSTNFESCYANSCLQTGYKLSGVNYSTLSGCAADGCSTAYSLYNCNGVNLLACGAESCRLLFDPEVTTETVYKGRAYSIRNSKNVSLINCYSMTSRITVATIDGLDISADDMNTDWNESRHIFVDTCTDVLIVSPALKSFQRIRTTPFKLSDGSKCNVTGGIYDPTIQGSRVWQAQNFLIGAQYEIRGETTRINIVSAQDELSLASSSEIRTYNLDILDPGIVPHPDGHSTALKAMSGDDGNGGWSMLVNGVATKIGLSSFEFLYPLSNKTGAYNKYWQWRNSLILLRKKDDVSLSDPNNLSDLSFRGYVDVHNASVGNPVNWIAAMAGTMPYKLDVVTDRDKTSRIDGSSAMFGYGTFMYQQDIAPIAYKVPVTNFLPAYTKNYVHGTRTKLNYDPSDTLDSTSNEAVTMFHSNTFRLNESGVRKFDPVTISKLKESRHDLYNTDILQGIIDKDGYRLFALFGDDVDKKILGFGADDSSMTKFLSRDVAARTAIEPLDVNTVTNSKIVNRVNALINALVAHGLIKVWTV